MDKYKEQFANSGLNLSHEEINKCIEIAKDVSNKLGTTVEATLDTIIAVLIYETVERNKNVLFE